MKLKDTVRLPPREFARKTVCFLHRNVYDLYYLVFHNRFFQIRRKCNGLCLVSVYKEIYKRALDLPDYDIVEVGGAAGASSIAFALALKESGKNSQVVVIEKCSGGTRSSYGGYDDNYRILTDNFISFEVDAYITLYPQALTVEKGPEVLSLINTKWISAFASDADGRIDRDFFLFWPRLIHGGMIVIDDYPRHISSETEKEEYYRTGRFKEVLTYELLNLFVSWGLFMPVKRVSNTIFGKKPKGADFEKFDMQICHDIVEDIKNAYLECAK